MWAKPRAIQKSRCWEGLQDADRLNQRIASVVMFRIALEDGIGGEVKLCGQRFVSASTDQIVDVLADAARIVARHDRIETILSFAVSDQCGAVTVAVEIVEAQMICLPDFDFGAREHVSSRI